MAYTKIQHEERLRFGLSCNDYCVADSICNLSNNDKNSYGWCYMTRTNLGESLGLTKQAILNIIDKLVKAELVEIHAETKYLRPTVLWYKNFTNGKENLPESNNSKVKKVYRSGKESLLSSGKESLLYIENITLKETIKRLKEESEFSKNENYALLSENEFIKSELEKAKELIKTLEEKTKKQKKEVTPKIEKMAFGEFQNVLLTSDQEQKLLEKHGKFKFECIIEKLSNAKEKNNKLKYDSDYAAIGSWVARSVEEDSDKKRNSQTNSLNGTTSQISNQRNGGTFSREQTALDLIAITEARFASTNV